MKEHETRTEDRREFLKTGAALAAGVATAGLLPGAVAAEESVAGTSEAKKKRYQATAHVLDYYRTARI